MEVATYACRSREELRIEAKKLISRFGDLRNEGLKLDMSRGKPSKLQLDLVSDMLTTLVDPCAVNIGQMCLAASRSTPSLAVTPA